MKDTDTMHAAFQELVAAMCQQPQQLRCSLTDGDTIILSLDSAPCDMGVLLGKKAMNIQSLRTIAYAMAAKRGCNATVVLEPKDTVRVKRTYTPNPQWSWAALEQTLLLAFAEIFDGALRLDWNATGHCTYQLNIYAQKLRPRQPELRVALGIIIGTIGISQGVMLTTELFEL